VTDFLTDKRQEITDRLKELKPLVDEYSRLEAAAAALAGIPDSQPSPNGRKGPGRPRGSKNPKRPTARAGRKAAGTTPGKASATKAAGTRRAGRRKGTGNRAAEALKFVTDQPGITIPELAAKMGIKQNYLYRVLPGLEQEKKVRKDGRGWHPTA
jgi:hypothetical protein